MHPNQMSAQDIESVRVAAILIIAAITIFWRIALRAALAIFAVTAIMGLLMLLHGIR